MCAWSALVRGEQDSTSAQVTLALARYPHAWAISGGWAAEKRAAAQREAEIEAERAAAELELQRREAEEQAKKAEEAKLAKEQTRLAKEEEARKQVKGVYYALEDETPVKIAKMLKVLFLPFDV